MSEIAKPAFWVGLRHVVSQRISTISASIPDPRQPEPPKRETNPQPLRVPLFDLTDIKPKPKTKEEDKS